MRLRRKHFFISILFVLAGYLLWLSILILRFNPHQTTNFAIQAPPYEVEGVYHLHTTHSDGTKSPDEIARLAASSSLDFIILTDHGRPNLASLASQGWKEDVLVLAGSELSVNRGHLVSLGFSSPVREFSQNAEQAAREVEARGGFSVIAHPFSKVNWSWGDTFEYSGIEIIDTDTMFKRNFLVSLPYLPALVFRPSFYLLQFLERPARTLRKWDELNIRHHVLGYFSADAHLFYSALLSGFHLHLLLDEPLSAEFEKARGQVFEALKEGRFFNAIEAAGAGRGFRFWAEGEKAKFAMGSSIRLQPEADLDLHIRAPFSSSVEILLIRDGRAISRFEERDITFSIREPGTYRVEVYLMEWSPLSEDIPWIVSNPIFIRRG